MRLFGRHYRRINKATYARDGLIAFHNADFLRDPRFEAAYQAGERTGSWKGHPVQWRQHVLIWAADNGRRLNGDFVECGVNRGGSALTVMRYLGFENLSRRFWLYDTFNGLMDSQLTDAERASRKNLETYEPCYDAVCKTFAEFGDAVKIVPGPIPDTLDISPEEVAYLHIDMNCVAPEIAAAEHFWPRMTAGALMVLDDYGWGGHIHQKHAFDDFGSRHDTTVLSLPTGQGIISKA